MGADVGVAKNEVISAEDYDDAVFQDDEEFEDLSYYKSTTQGKKGRPLCDGGPKKPDTSGLCLKKAVCAKQHRHFFAQSRKLSNDRGSSVMSLRSRAMAA